MGVDASLACVRAGVCARRVAMTRFTHHLDRVSSHRDETSTRLSEERVFFVCMWCRVFYFNDKNMYSLRVETFARGDARARQRAETRPKTTTRAKPPSANVSRFAKRFGGYFKTDTVTNHHHHHHHHRIRRRYLDLFLDHVGSLLDGGDLFRSFLVERDLELLLERHHDFDGVERVGAQVDKLGVRRDGVEVGTELFGDDGSDLVEGIFALRTVSKHARARGKKSVETVASARALAEVGVASRRVASSSSSSHRVVITHRRRVDGESHGGARNRASRERLGRASAELNLFSRRTRPRTQSVSQSVGRSVGRSV